MILPSLRLVVGSNAAPDHVDLAECRHHGIAVTNSGDTNSKNMADYTVALLLDVLLQVSVADQFVRFGLWPQMGEYPLCCKVAGISVVGLIYGSVSAGVGLVYGFRSWPWVSDRVSSCGFLGAVGRGFDCGGIWFEI